MNLLRRFYFIAMPITFCVTLLPAAVRAQVVPAGFESNHAVWVGGECSIYSASFPYGSGQRIDGCGAFANLRWAPHFDVEGDARWLAFGGFAGSTESSYLAGRVTYSAAWKIPALRQVSTGQGRHPLSYQIGNRTYCALAPGGGLNYRIASRLTLRAEYEYQIWPNSPGFANEPDHPLKPNGFNFGVAYEILHF